MHGTLQILDIWFGVRTYVTAMAECDRQLRTGTVDANDAVLKKV